jgi:hypothetical protein
MEDGSDPGRGLTIGDSGESEGINKGAKGNGAVDGGEGSLIKKVERETEDCQICMDAEVEVRFQECEHSTCFECACRLCLRATEAPSCPFCRQGLQSVEPLVGAKIV